MPKEGPRGAKISLSSHLRSFFFTKGKGTRIPKRLVVDRQRELRLNGGEKKKDANELQHTDSCA